jgi:endonuclease/exonuclease/phosphatase family metal-dependent hydrolase
VWLALVSCFWAAEGCSSTPEPALPPRMTQAQPRTTLKVMSFNVRCSIYCIFPAYWSSDLWWRNRVPRIVDTIGRHGPDLISFQEFTHSGDVDDVLARLPQYAAVYHAGDGRRRTWTDTTLFYDRARFELLERQEFWLCEATEGRSMWSWLRVPRLSIWLRLHDRITGESFYFGGAHFDNNRPAQSCSAEQILERTRAWSRELPLLLAGDLNSDANPESPWDSEGYTALVEGLEGHAFVSSIALLQAGASADGEARSVRYAGDGTVPRSLACFAGNPGEFPSCAIDHVMLGGAADWRVHDWVVDLHDYGRAGREPVFPSDHRAIMVELSLE